MECLFIWTQSCLLHSCSSFDINPKNELYHGNDKKNSIQFDCRGSWGWLSTSSMFLTEGDLQGTLKQGTRILSQHSCRPSQIIVSFIMLFWKKKEKCLESHFSSKPCAEATDNTSQRSYRLRFPALSIFCCLLTLYTSKISPLSSAVLSIKAEKSTINKSPKAYSTLIIQFPSRGAT